MAVDVFGAVVGTSVMTFVGAVRFFFNDGAKSCPHGMVVSQSSEQMRLISSPQLLLGL